MINYNFFQKILHDLVFKLQIINTSLYELEKFLYLKKSVNYKNNIHVFISGMPRSGTTSLLNFIYSSNIFGSLKYENMPFLLSPNLLKIFNKNSFIKKRERLHSDGIYYDISSPESFDEVFFENFKGKFDIEFINYVNLILLSEKKSRYISKNNLSYKRIESISANLPNSIFLIPIRHPYQTANSLLNQHINFSRMQKKNDFILRYMNYLGHNEFGLNHKFWNKPKQFQDVNSVNYWVEQWFLFYKDIFTKFKFKKNCYFIIYENLEKKEYIDRLCNTLNITNNDETIFFKNNNKNINYVFDENISKLSLNLYKEIKNTNSLNPL